MKREIRLAYPYLSVRIEKEELAENYIYTLLFTVDTILSELGIDEITEDNIGEVIKLLRLPLFYIHDIKKFIENGKAVKPSPSPYAEGKGKKIPQKEHQGRQVEAKEDSLEPEEEGLFLTKPTYKSIFEYPLVEEEEKIAVEVNRKLIALIFQHAQNTSEKEEAP